MECKCEQIAQRITLVPSTIIKMNMRMAEMLFRHCQQKPFVATSKKRITQNKKRKMNSHILIVLLFAECSATQILLISCK